MAPLRRGLSVLADADIKSPVVVKLSKVYHDVLQYKGIAVLALYGLQKRFSHPNKISDEATTKVRD